MPNIFKYVLPLGHRLLMFRTLSASCYIIAHVGKFLPDTSDPNVNDARLEIQEGTSLYIAFSCYAHCELHCCLLPALCLATSLVALRNLRALRRNNGQWGRTAMILAIEAAVCASLAVVWALGGYGGGAWLSTSAARFFYTICGGWGMFNNLLCGLHWRSQKLWFALDADDAAARSPASKDAASPTGAAPDRRREALLLGALAIPTVGVDTLISVEAATYSGHVLARVRLYAIGLLVANYIASGAGPRARDGRG